MGRNGNDVGRYDCTASRPDNLWMGSIEPHRESFTEIVSARKEPSYDS